MMKTCLVDTNEVPSLDLLSELVCSVCTTPIVAVPSFSLSTLRAVRWYILLASAVLTFRICVRWVSHSDVFYVQPAR